jgi:hypothetical protein
VPLSAACEFDLILEFMEASRANGSVDDVWEEENVPGSHQFEKEMWERSLYKLKNNFGNVSSM